MIAYLKSKNYDVSNFHNPSKLLSHGVSSRDFNDITTFLMRRIDPTFNTSSANSATTRSDEPPMKFEEEVSMVYKTLGYPLPISKTGIVAVGAPNTWPSLILAIDWLIDLLAVAESESSKDWCDDNEERDVEELYAFESNTERATRQFYGYLRKSMPVFLDGGEERMQELEVELKEVWEADDKRCDAYLEGIEGECGRLRGWRPSLPGKFMDPECFQVFLTLACR